MSFLKADWSKLIMINYEVSSDCIKAYVPKGTVLDTYNGKCFISIVGLLFRNTKLLGLSVPYHKNFEEVNLRIYVERKDGLEQKKGVVFIKEIVPKAAISFVANTLYNENYETLPMNHEITRNTEELNVCYKWRKNNVWNSIAVKTEPNLCDIEENSIIDFISERYWGYSKGKRGTTEYEVKHPKWQYYPVINYNVEIDFESIYGTSFSFLQTERPSSVMLLEGSMVTVENKNVV